MAAKTQPTKMTGNQLHEDYYNLYVLASEKHEHLKVYTAFVELGGVLAREANQLIDMGLNDEAAAKVEQYQLALEEAKIKITGYVPVPGDVISYADDKFLVLENNGNSGKVQEYPTGVIISPFRWNIYGESSKFVSHIA
jgi:hypothetical protein